MKYPTNLRYTKEHEWAQVEGNTITIGITHHAQNSLGDIVFVELPPAGKTLKKGETFGVVESIKAVSDLYAPCAGKIAESNSLLPNDPSIINKDPHGSAWMIKLEVSDPQTALEGLMDAESYAKFTEKL